MRPSNIHHSTFNQPNTSIVLVIALLFLLRSLIPAGWMPAMGDSPGGTLLTLCTGQGTQTILVDENWQPIENSETPSSQKPTDQLSKTCPFFLLVHAVNLVDGPNMASPVTYILALAHTKYAVHWFLSFTSLQLYVRGPPQLI